MKKILMMVLLGMGFMSSCALSSLQSANTVRPGHVSAYGAGGGFGSQNVQIPIPNVDFGVRVGLNNNMDFGLRPFLLGAYGDLKFAFFQSQKFGPSLAVDLGFGYSSWQGVSLYAIDLGPIFSFKLGKLVNPYILAKYRYMGGSASGSGISLSDSPVAFGLGSFITATVGLELFPDFLLSPVIEVSQFFNTSGASLGDFYMYNFGLKINI